MIPREFGTEKIEKYEKCENASTILSMFSDHLPLPVASQIRELSKTFFQFLCAVSQGLPTLSPWEEPLKLQVAWATGKCPPISGASQVGEAHSPVTHWSNLVNLHVGFRSAPVALH